MGRHYLESYAENTVLANCGLRALEIGERYSSGSLGEGLLRFHSTGGVARGCDFVDIITSTPSYQIPVVCTSNEFLFVQCVFTNCTWAYRNMNNVRANVTAISNRFMNCVSELEACSSSGDPSDGLFRGAYAGIDKLTLAYNVFYNDATMSGRSKTVVQSCRETLNGGVLAHHNTVVGWDNFISLSNLNSGSKKVEVFDNVLALNGGGLVFNEAWFYIKSTETITNNVPSSFKSGSYFRNNHCAGAVNGGTLTQYAGYDFASRVAVSNTVTSPAPVFISMNPTSPDYFRLKVSENAWVKTGWTNNGTYPAYIGAVEPKRAVPMVIILR